MGWVCKRKPTYFRSPPTVHGRKSFRTTIKKPKNMFDSSTIPTNDMVPAMVSARCNMSQPSTGWFPLGLLYFGGLCFESVLSGLACPPSLKASKRSALTWQDKKGWCLRQTLLPGPSAPTHSARCPSGWLPVHDARGKLLLQPARVLAGRVSSFLGLVPLASGF